MSKVTKIMTALIANHQKVRLKQSSVLISFQINVITKQKRNATEYNICSSEWSLKFVEIFT